MGVIDLYHPMPYFAYYGPTRDHGTLVNNGNIAPGSGSTVIFRVTRVGRRDFDAVFSGKVWSAQDPDTLMI